MTGRARRPGQLRADRPRRRRRLERIVETKDPDDVDARGARDQARSTPAPTPSTPRRWPRRSTTDRQRQRRRASTTSATCCRCSATRGPAGRRPPGRRPERQPRRQHPRRPRRRRGRGARARSSSATCSPGSRSSIPPRPGSTPTSRSPPTPRSSPAPRCAARTEVGAGSVIGPHTTLIDSDASASRRRGPALLPGRVRGRRRCTVGPFAYLRPDADARREGAKAGTFVEIKNSRDRRGRQGPAPLLRRRRRRRRRTPTSAPARSPPTTTVRASTGRRSGTGARIGVDTSLVAPVERRRRRLHWRRCGDPRGRPARSARVSANEQRNIEGYAERKAAGERARRTD